MREELCFMVQGSAADPYQVRIVNRGKGNISAYCTCPAGEKKSHCKHRINILNGKTMGIVSGNESEVKKVLSWVPGSDLELAMKKVEEMEYQLDLAKSNLNKSKKMLAMAMLD